MNTYKNISLKNYHTFHIDELAEQLVIFHQEKELMDYFSTHDMGKKKFLVIGEGSNLLFTKAFDGIIFKIENKGIEILDNIGDHIWVKVAAGESWDDLVSWAVENSYGGIENLSLIPGTVGAAPVQNIGAYGVEFKDVFNSLEAIEIDNGEKRSFYLQEMNFDYRYSAFKGEWKNKFLISSVVIKLHKYPKLDLHYGHLKQVAQEISGKSYPDIADIRKAVIQIRNSKLPNTDEIGNAGSFFKNPIINKKTYEELLLRFPHLVSYPLENGDYKLAAAWLIEQAGFKGFSQGQAATHEQHALIIINKGNAGGEEIKQLSKNIQEGVFEKFRVQLEPEVLIF